ncbi:MAG: hypothetical protein WCJ84_00345 [Candidatus Peregrinibacteria bacterium]
MKTQNLYFIGGFFLSFESLEKLVHHKVASQHEEDLFHELKAIA